MNDEADWQTNCAVIKDRGKELLQYGKWSDCKFWVGTKMGKLQLFSAHKLILAMSSPVFERMFYGNSVETCEVLEVPDITPFAFETMLKYIYTDAIVIESFENACELYYAAKKYTLPQVHLKCISYLIQNLQPENICKAHEFAQLFNELALENRCTQMFSIKIKEIVLHPNFLKIRLSTLREIFSLKHLIIPEIDLFKALHDYAAANDYISILREREEKQLQSVNTQEIYTPDSDEIPQTKRNVDDLKHAIRQIRFLSLSPQQFVDLPVKSGLLTVSEALAILVNIVSPTDNYYPMPEGFSKLTNQRY